MTPGDGNIGNAIKSNEDFPFAISLCHTPMPHPYAEPHVNRPYAKKIYESYAEYVFEECCGIGLA